MSIVRVGVGILARHPSTNQVLLGQRTVKHGQDTFSFPGGHLEFGESFAECAARELLEETNLTFDGVPTAIATLNNIFHLAGKHYVTILFVTPTILMSRITCPNLLTCRRMEGTVKDVDALINVEADKCAGWEWVSETQIKDWIRSGERTLFLPIVNYYQDKMQ